MDLTTKKLVMNLSGGASVLASPNQSSTAQLIGCVFPSIRLQFLNWMCWELFFFSLNRFHSLSESSGAGQNRVGSAELKKENI